jgi:RNA polymerase sigma-70 factor (ECF subfamily)
VAEVEDLVQECFAAVIVATDNGTAEAMSMPWLMRVARNKLIDHYRREKVRRIRLPLLRGDLVDEVTLWHGEASREAARESLAALAPDHRAVLVLRHLDGLSVPEIAQLIGKSIHATESVLARARVAFKREFVEVTRD